MLSHKLVLAVLLTMTLGLMAACGGAAAVPTAAAPTLAPTLAPTTLPSATAVPTATAPATATVPPATGTPASLTLTDDAGRQVTINGTPQRIISLAPSTTEIAFAVGASGRVIAVDQYSDYPAAAKSLPQITSGFNYNNEQIVALKPDLVLAAGITGPDEVKKLEDLHLTVLVVGAAATTLDGIRADILLAGQALGAADQAKQVVANMDARVAAVKAKIAQATTTPRVYWELDATDPAKPYAPGPGSFISDLVKLAGGVNVTDNAKSSYAQVSAEEIIKDNPQIIILSDASYGIAVDSVKTRPGWNVIDAVMNGKVFPIDDNLVSRPGPRIVDGLEAAAKLIHPELFP